MKPKTPKTTNKPVIGESIVTLGKTKKDNLVVNYLLLNMAKLMLANLNPDDKYTRLVQETADRAKTRLQASHTEDELAPIKLMSDTAVAMARKLARCEDVAQLEASLSYMQRLLEGEVYVVDDVANPEDHGLTPNV